MGANNPNKTDAITQEGLLQLFSGFGSDSPRTSGGENEIFFTFGGPGFLLPNDDIHVTLTAPYRGEDSPINYSDEPGAYMLEVKNDPPYAIVNLSNAPKDIWRQKHRLTVKMDEMGLKHSPFSCVPFSSFEDCIGNIIGSRGAGATYTDRITTLMGAYEQHGLLHTVSRNFITNDSIHWTTSVKTPQDAFQMARLQVAMMPFWFIYTENRPPYQNNSPERVDHHTGISSRKALCERGMYPDFLFAAKDHRDFIDRMIEQVLHTKMLAYFDHNSKITAAPKNIELTASNMQGRGPEDISQFEQAMSQIWLHYKLKQSPDGKGTLFERRDFDEGPETFQDVMLVCSMIDNDDTARHRLIHILEQGYGIPLFSDPATADGIIRHNMDAALRRGTDGARFVDTPFGAASKGKTVHNFLNDTLLPMMEQFHQNTGMENMLHSWRFKAEYGMTNAQVWYDLFKSMDQQRGFITELMEESDYHDRFVGGYNWGEQLKDSLDIQPVLHAG